MVNENSAGGRRPSLGINAVAKVGPDGYTIGSAPSSKPLR